MKTDELLEQITLKGNPAVTRLDDRYKAVFMYQGKTSPYIVGDFNLWGADGATQFTALEADLWRAQVELPHDAYIEYLLSTTPDDDTTRFNDPLNTERTAYNGIDGYNNYFYMPDAPPPIRRKSKIQKGKASKDTIHDTMVIGKQRDIWFYDPPTTQAVPLIVVYDGYDYLNRGKITAILDNLIAEGKMQPVALAMVRQAYHSGRFTEYNHGEAILRVITRYVLPMAQARLNLIDIDAHPGAYGVVGASMGGLQALYTAIRLPHIFHNVIAQSGAFISFDGGLTQPLIYTLIDYMPAPPPIKVWLDVGRMEFLHQPVRLMAQMLQDKGWDVTLLEYNAGHNYTAWSKALIQALPQLFPSKK